MITIYSNQFVTLKSLTSIDEYGQASYTNKIIPARFEYQRKVVKNRQGVEVVSEARLFTEEIIKPDDVVTYAGRDWTVIFVAEKAGLSGEVEHYEVRL